MSGRTVGIGLCAITAAWLTGSQAARSIGARACLDAGGAFGAPRNCDATVGESGARSEARSAWLIVGLASALAAVGTIAVTRMVPRR